MKKTVIILCLLIFGLTMVAKADAIEYRRGMFMVTPFLGLGLPFGDMADDDFSNSDALARKMGLKFGIMLDYWLNQKIAAGLQFKYVNFPSKDIEDFESDEKLRLLKIGAALKYAIVTQGAMLAYLVGGGGWMFPKFTDTEIYNPETEQTEQTSLDIDGKPYFMFGGAFNYFVGATIALFAELTIDYLLFDGAEVKHNDISFGEFQKNYLYLDLVFGVSFFFGGSE